MQFKRLDAEDIDLIVKTLQEFAARETPAEQRLKWDASDTCPEDVVRAMLGPDVGLHLVFLPEEHGGMGGGAYDVYRLSTEFARIDLGLATAMLAVASAPIRSASAVPTSRSRSGFPGLPRKASSSPTASPSPRPVRTSRTSRPKRRASRTRTGGSRTIA